jgi:methyl-accepting chemotaxis protein
VEEQTAATNEIARNAAEASRGSGEITRSVAGVSEAVRTTTEAAGQTLTAAQELAQLAASLESVVKEFKIESSGARGETSRHQTAKPVKAPASSSRAGNGHAAPQTATSSRASGNADPFVHGNAAHPRA